MVRYSYHERRTDGPDTSWRGAAARPTSTSGRAERALCRFVRLLALHAVQPLGQPKEAAPRRSGLHPGPPTPSVILRYEGSGAWRWRPSPRAHSLAAFRPVPRGSGFNLTGNVVRHLKAPNYILPPGPPVGQVSTRRALLIDVPHILGCFSRNAPNWAACRFRKPRKSWLFWSWLFC
mgnify:CR=1 FL=1